MPEDLDLQPSKFGQSETRIFLDLALERGYVSQEQVDETLQIREKLQEMGLDEKVQALMVKKGFISETDARRVGKALSGYRRLGNYEIIARVGQGSMGTVFKARQISMDRNVALKILPPKLASDKIYVERFMREARAVAKLNHVNIVQGIDVGEEKGYYYFAMEYVEGITARETLKSKGPYREKEALGIIVQIARALDHASEAGLVHRDVKPDNIIITPQSVAKLLDLGIAKTVGAAGEEGVRLGTPYYISPEQARGDADVDARSDIYSLGATFYHMVVGSPPFSGSSAEEVIRAHLTSTVPNPREVRPGLSRNVSRIIEMMMARDPEDRYQAADELLADLDKVSRGLPPGKAKTFRGSSSVAVGPETAGTSMTRPVEGVPGKRRLPLAAVLGGAGALLLIIVVVLIVALTGDPDNGERNDPLPPPNPTPTPVPTPTPTPTNRTEKDASEMLAEARKRLRNTAKPADLEHDAGILKIVVEQTKGTATFFDAKKQYDGLRARLQGIIKKTLDDLWRKADAASGRNRYAAAFAELDKFPRSFRKYPRWGTAYGRNRGEIDKRAKAWLTAREKRAEALTKKFDFENARAALTGMSVAGLPGLAERVARGLAKVKTAEDARAKFLAAEKVRLAAAQARRGEVLYQGFLRDLYSKHAPKGFAAAESFCNTVKRDKKYEIIKSRADDEIKDLEVMKAAGEEVAALLAAVRGNVTVTIRGQKLTGRIQIRDGKVWLSTARGAVTFPLVPDQMVPAELLALTGYGSGDAKKALSAGLYLTWRRDYGAARSNMLRAKGPAAARGLRRLDLLQKGMTELQAEGLIAAAKEAHAARNFRGFAARLGELRGKFAKTKAFARARAELEKLELDAALAGLSLEGLCAARSVKAEAGLLAFEYDFGPNTPQVLDWESAISMWRWGQNIHNRAGIDTEVTNAGRLRLRSPAQRLLQVLWGVPIEGLRSVEFEVTPRGGSRSVGLGLGRPYVYKPGEKLPEKLRVWFSSKGKPYILQGESQRKMMGRELLLEANKAYRVKLELTGGQVVLSLDGRELLRDKLTFDVSRGCRLVLGTWRAQADFDKLKIVCKPSAAWLKRRAGLQVKFRQAGVKPGITAEYFSDRGFKKSVLKRVEPAMYFWWSQRSPAPKVPQNNFSVRFKGKIYVEKAGRYRLSQRCDDHGRLWVGGKKIIDGNFNKGADVDLKAGFNDFTMEVSEGGGFAGQELSWETKGLPRQVIPPELLGH